MERSTYIVHQSVPLVVDYETNDHGDVLISQVWIAGIRMMPLMGDDVLTKLRYAIKNEVSK